LVLEQPSVPETLEQSESNPPPPVPPPPGAFEPLPKDDAAAIELVKASTDQRTLMAWFELNTATRPDVADVIMQRLVDLDSK
jgi:hypothetical protein